VESPSYVSGVSDIPLMGETIGQCFDRAARTWADREAIVVRHQGVRWTYAKLHREVEDLAKGLLTLGLDPGDRVGIWSPNNVQWVQLQLACAKAGLILVTINPAYRLTELEHALTLSGCRALVTASRFKSSDYLEMVRTLVPDPEAPRTGDRRLPDLQFVIHLDPEPQAGMIAFDEVVGLGRRASSERLDALGGALQFDDPINIQFTSGTTGAPKGATLTHHNILNNGFFVAQAMGLGEGDRLCIPVPLYHCFGMVMSVLSCVTTGAVMVFPGDSFEPLSVLETVEAERCTHLHGVPTMFIAEIGHPEFGRFDLSSLRGGIMAGAPCPIEVMRQVLEKMHMREVTIAYGMTETSPVSFQSRVNDSIERRVSTVGTILPHLEVKIVDEAGRIVPRGVSGEILTRGYSVMREYWAQPDKTAESIDSGRWMHTGDIGVIDEAGYCNIVGRIKDMVIRGGENVFPREIEEFLFRHPKIESVQVFGVPDDKYGEEICAWIMLRPGESMAFEDVVAFCKGQIAHYKVPRYVEFVEAFPMTVTGKAQKFLMREEASRRLGLKARPSA
jgi:fatty-acyl-CoA synthase